MAAKVVTAVAGDATRKPSEVKDVEQVRLLTRVPQWSRGGILTSAPLDAMA